jgi:Caspase domain/Domain of unknown function (DUF4384)
MKKMQGLALAAMLSTVLSLAHAAEPVKEKPAAPKPLSGAALLQLDDGRSGRGNLIATTGIRGFSKPPSANSHALIMTIGDYQGNIPKLKGVPFDIATATEIAQRMGVPAANIHALKDGELTLEGMRRALDELEAKLGGNDQVFIYYSGHGGRQLVQEDGEERCAESLITVDGQGFTDTEMESRLKRFSDKAQKTIVFLDACHSGGVTTRAVSSAPAAYMAKAYTPPGQSCVKPTNILTRGILAPKAAGSGGGNFVHIAAARDSEISLDQPGRGGVASQAWLACLSGAAKDTDGSGGLSAQEIQTCAQGRIEDQLKGAQGFLPHHVSIIGNPAMVLSYAVKEVAPAPVPAPALPVAVAVPVSAPVKVPVAQAIPIAPAAPVPVAVTKPSALAALNDIYNNRDDRRLVTLTAAKSSLKIGRDNLDFTLNSREGGYVYLMMVGSDGQTFDLLFPNQLDRNNLIEVGGSMRLPRPAWQLSAEGPPGKDTLLAIVTDSPRDFNDAGLKPSGPFSAVAAVAAKDIQLVTLGGAQASSTVCSGPAATRNLSVQKSCSNGYAATLLTIEEVR